MHRDTEREPFDSGELDAGDHDAEMAAEAEYEAEMYAQYRDDMLAGMPSAGEIARTERDQAKWAEERITTQLANEQLAEFYVEWDTITQADVNALRKAINSAEGEEDIQVFLTAHPQFLTQHLSGGHGRFVLPKPSLGGIWVPDYLLVHEDSAGVHWQGLELESPRARLCTKPGQPTAQLTHALQQITDWRAWIGRNIGTARQTKQEGGSGLIGIDADLPSTVLMGRRQPYPQRFNDYRNEVRRGGTEIHSYDWLIDQAQYRVDALGRPGGG